MKKNYFLVLLMLSFFSTSISFGSSCPNAAFTTGTTIFAIYPSGTSACVDRPTSLTVGASIFTLIICEDSYSQYQLTSGTPVTVTDPFTIDTGFDTPCTYEGGILGIEEIGLINKASFKIYPNPYSTSKNDNITVSFAINTSADIYIYDISGKVIVTDAINNSNTKEINVSNLDQGIYLLKIATDSFSLTRKVVIIK